MSSSRAAVPTDADRIAELEREVVELRLIVLRLRALIPRTRLEAFDRAREVADLVAEVGTAAARERLGLSSSTFYRALRRVPRKRQKLSIRSTQHVEDRMKLNVGQTTPPPMDKYGSARRPSPPASDTPRGDNVMANGETAGNFKPYLRPNNPGVDPTGDGAAEGTAARETK